MVRRAIAFTLVSAAIAVVACNALTGLSDLSVSASGGEGGPMSSSGSSGASSGSSGNIRVDGSVIYTDSRAPDGGRVPPPSCAGSTLRCGTDSLDCCESTGVPGGTFERANSTNPVDKATVSPFLLDRFEVTVARFRAFRAKGGATQLAAPPEGSGADPKVPGSGWNSLWNTLLPANPDTSNSALQGGTWTNDPGKNELRPMTMVTWFEAYAFCIWDGGRLPTYAEWSFAASGGSDQRYYPWSQSPTDKTIDNDHCVWDCSHISPPLTCYPAACSDTTITTTPCDPTTCGVDGGTCVTPPCTGCDYDTDLPAVGSAHAGMSKYGQFDLSGSVSETLLDARANRNNVDFPSPCTDCTQLMGPYPHKPPGQPADDYQFMVAGGNWSDGNDQVASSAWFRAVWDDRNNSRGFRCARDP